MTFETALELPRHFFIILATLYLNYYYYFIYLRLIFRLEIYSFENYKILDLPTIYEIYSIQSQTKNCIL